MWYCVLSNGSKEIPKERIEIMCEGKVLQLNNYVNMRGYGFEGFKKARSLKQDKGQERLCKAFVQATQGLALPPIPFEEIMEVSKVTLAIADEVNK